MHTGGEKKKNLRGEEEDQAENMAQHSKQLVDKIAADQATQVMNQIMEEGTWREILAYQYKRDEVQGGISAFILLYFLIIVVQNEYENLIGEDDAKTIDLCFLVGFTSDLGWNMIAHVGVNFFNNAWNMFDLITVAGSLLLLALSGVITVDASLLTIIRSLRILKIFGKNKYVQQLIAMVGAAAGGCVAVAGLAILIMSIYGLMGKALFTEAPTYDEHWGCYSRTIYTLFQAMTFESWSMGVARPVMEAYEDFPMKQITALFFVSYAIGFGIFVVNIIMAVFFEAWVAGRETTVARESVEQMQILCSYIDRDRDGTIDYEEVKKAMIEYGLEGFEPQKDPLFCEADKFNKGQIDYIDLYYASLKVNAPENGTPAIVSYELEREIGHAVEVLNDRIAPMVAKVEDNESKLQQLITIMEGLQSGKKGKKKKNVKKKKKEKEEQEEGEDEEESSTTDL